MPALSLRTYFWLAGCAFIVGASLGFAAYLKYHWPWWAMVAILGGGVGAVVMGLEWAVAGPLERLARGPGRAKDGSLTAPPAPTERYAATEARKLWRGMRTFHEQAAQMRAAQSGLETRLDRALVEARLLRTATEALRPEVSLADQAPALMRDLAAALGVPAVWLVPLRRACPVPVTGPDGTPGWGEELRETGLAVWDDLLAEDRPLALSLTDRAPAWRRHFAHETLWIVPLVYHRRVQGLLLARPTGGERAWTPEETALLRAIAPVLAAALHPPRWSDARRKGDYDPDESLRLPLEPTPRPVPPVPAPAPAPAAPMPAAPAPAAPAPVPPPEAPLPPYVAVSPPRPAAPPPEVPAPPTPAPPTPEAPRPVKLKAPKGKGKPAPLPKPEPTITLVPLPVAAPDPEPVAEAPAAPAAYTDAPPAASWLVALAGGNEPAAGAPAEPPADDPTPDAPGRDARRDRRRRRRAGA